MMIGLHLNAFCYTIYLLKCVTNKAHSAMAAEKTSRWSYNWSSNAANSCAHNAAHDNRGGTLTRHDQMETILKWKF